MQRFRQSRVYIVGTFSPMHLFIIAIPIALVIPALYFLFTRKSKGGDGTENRSDATERSELTGTEQKKRREDL